MKGKSIIEVVIVFILMKFFSIWFDTWLKGIGVHYGWRDLCFGLQAIVIPLAIIWLSKRNWSAYGLGRANFRYLIHYGFIGAMIMMLAGLCFGFLRSQQIDPKGREGSLIMSAVALIMIGVLFFASRRSNQNNDSDNRHQPRVIYKLIILIGMVLCPVVVAILRKCLTFEIVAWDLYYLFMVGFGEEIKYRGYFQSRVNEEYGRLWEVFGIRFGPGLIIVSVLFGFSHMGQFGSFNPFEGQFDISPWMGLQAFFGSLFYGLIREKSGSVIPSSIAHGVPNAFGQTLAKVLG
jgi:membrane protease YdiL (CAAX protease family)